MKDVFISYKAEEFDEANWVKQTLENNGISCWMAPMSIPGGSSYAVEIPQAIRACRVFVLILSKQSQLSKWVPRELDQAINENKTVMPFMLENCALKDDFNFYLTNVQRYAAYESKAAAIEKMINEIRAILGVGNGADGIASEAAAVETPAEDLSKKGEAQAPGAGEAQTPGAGEAQAPGAGEAQAPGAGEAQAPAAGEKHTRKKGGKPEDGKAKSGGKPRKKGWLILLAVIPIIVLAIIISAVSGKVTVAGVSYDKDSFTVEIKGAVLSNDDIEALSGMKTLYTLKISDSDISNADFSLLKCDKLDSLYIENSNLTDAKLKSLPLENVTKLSLAGNRISDLSAAKLSDRLVSLNIDGNKPADILSLSACKKLQSLSVSGCGLKSLSGLENCIELKSINASNNELSGLNGLENATLLEDVIISGNMISDISLLDKSSAVLKRLIADGNSLASADALANCAALTDLSLNGNQLESLDALAGVSSIVNISVKSNRLTSLAGLEKCTGIKYLNASDNAITDTSAIAAIVSDEGYSDVCIVLSDNSISDLKLPNVRFQLLAVQNNKIADYSPLYGAEYRNLVFNYDASVDFAKLKSGSDYYNYYYIIGCPLDKQISVNETLGEYNSDFIDGSETNEIIDKYLPDRLNIN